MQTLRANVEEECKGRERERGSKGKCRDIGSQKGRNEGGREKCGENWEKAPPAAAVKFRGEARRSATRRVAILWMNIFVYVTHNVKVIKCRQKIVGFDLKFEIVVYLLFSFWTICFKWLNALRHSALPWRRRFLSVCLCPFRCRCLSALLCSFYTVYFIVVILFHLFHCFLFLILFALCCSWPCKICWQTDTTSVFWLSSLTWLHTHTHTQSTQNTHSTRTHTHTYAAAALVHCKLS